MAGKEEKATDNNLPEIRSQYWTEPIKALRPVRVYMHHYNLVLVQKMSGEVEEGKYISSPISSYLPKSGDDGFILSPNPKHGNMYPFLPMEPSISRGQEPVRTRWGHRIPVAKMTVKALPQQWLRSVAGCRRPRLPSG